MAEYSLFSDSQESPGPSKADLTVSKKRLTSRRTFLKAAAATGAVGAMYAVPKLTSVHSRPAYATTGICPPDFCIEWGTRKESVTPISYPGTIEQFYGYGAPDASSANTPSVELELEPNFNAHDGLEQIRLQNGNLHGDIAVFALVRTSDGNVHLVTLLDSPGDGSGGTANICYSGLPSGTTWSVKDDDPGVPVDVHSIGGDGTTAELDSEWFACCTDGGALSPTPGNPFSCESRICIDIKETTGIGPVCFASQTTPPDGSWDPNLSGENLDAPVIKLWEVGGDFCIDGDWDTID